MPSQKFTQSWVSAVNGQDKRIEYFDKHTSGLGVRITPKGKKTFFYRYYKNGKNKRYSIGPFPAISLADARSKVRELKVKVQEGSDPQQDKIDFKAKPTEKQFYDLCEIYIERHLPQLAPSTIKEYKRVIDKELKPELGQLTASKVSRRHVMEVIENIAIDRDAPVMANRVLAIASSIFNYSLIKGYIEANPAYLIPKYKEEARDRYYSDAEIKELWTFFDSEDEPIRSLFKLLLLNGQRLGETKSMEWSHIGNDNVWRIPSENTKTKQAQTVYLSDQSLEILDELKSYSGDSKYVFLSSRKEDSFIRWTHKAGDRAKEHTSVTDFRFHDLRRTVATNITRLGFPDLVASKVLNHKIDSRRSQVTAIYDRYDYAKEKRMALCDWGERLFNQIIT